MINTDIFRYRKPTEEQLARMARVTEAQKSVETYLLNLHVVGPSSRTATSDSAMAALKVVGQWARRGIALEPTAPARGT